MCYVPLKFVINKFECSIREANITVYILRISLQFKCVTFELQVTHIIIL